MATHTWTSAPTTTTDAAFRAWAQGIHDAIAACGWVQTTDTGQVNLATATTGTGYLYEVWRLDDAMQATAPIFLKIEYRQNYPQVYITVGQATDGAGNLSGIILPRTGNTGQSTASTSEFVSYASGDGSSLCIVTYPTSSGYYQWCLVIDRTRDAAGVPTAEGFLVAFLGQSTNACIVQGNGGSSTSKNAVFHRAPLILPATVNGMQLSVGLSKDGIVAPVFPVTFYAPGVTPWLCHQILAIHTADASTTGLIQVTLNGALRTFRTFSGLTQSGMFQLGYSGSYVFPAILWEG